MSRPYTVVIIEDDPQSCQTLTAYREDSSCVVLEVGDGLEGLEAFTRAQPDIVFTDLRMPVIMFTGTGDLRVPDRAPP